MKHTKAIQGKDNHAKAIQALNEEQIRMRKAVIQKSDGFRHADSHPRRDLCYN